LTHTVGLLWTNDQPVAEASTYTEQHKIETQETNIHALSGIRTRDPSKTNIIAFKYKVCGSPIIRTDIIKGLGVF
jgi:hypothetical protein